MDSSASDDDDTLSREEVGDPTSLNAPCNAMAIVQGYTPSGLATSTP